MIPSSGSSVQGRQNRARHQGKLMGSGRRDFLNLMIFPHDKNAGWSQSNQNFRELMQFPSYFFENQWNCVSADEY